MLTQDKIRSVKRVCSNVRTYLEDQMTIDNSEEVINNLHQTTSLLTEIIYLSTMLEKHVDKEEDEGEFEILLLTVKGYLNNVSKQLEKYQGSYFPKDLGISYSKHKIVSQLEEIEN